MRAPHRVLAEEDDEGGGHPREEEHVGRRRAVLGGRDGARRRSTTAPMRQHGGDEHDGVAIAHRAEDLGQVGAGRAIGGDLEVVARTTAPTRSPGPHGSQSSRWKPMAVAAPATIGASRRPASSTRAAGTMTGARSAFTETVAPMPRPIHIARRTVTSCRHRRTIAIGRGGEGQRGPVGGDRPGDPERGRREALTSPAASSAPLGR